MPEECDDGNNDYGDGCNPGCRTENQSYWPSGATSDFDVDGLGNIVLVGATQASGGVFHCYNSDFVPQKPVTTWYNLAAELVAVSAEPRVVRSSQAGTSMMLWAHYTIPLDYTSRRLDVRFLESDCTVMTNSIRIFDGQIEEFYDLDMDDQGNAGVAFVSANHGYLRLFNSDGSDKIPNTVLQGATCKYGIHLALSPLGNGGVVSCQGDLAEGVVFWTFDANGNFTAVAQPMPGAAGHTGWYDSHNVYAANGGEFALVSANPSTAEVYAAFYNSNGALTWSGTIWTNLAPPKDCYDMYRFGNMKNVLSNGRYVISAISIGECFAKDHNLVLVVNPANGQTDHIITAPLPLQRLKVDRVGNSYMLNQSSQMLINQIWLPL